MMLEKLQGNPIISKLHIIQLFEAYFNAALKIKIGRQLMRQKQVDKELGEEMHGVRRGHTDHDALVTQQINIDIATQYRHPGNILNLYASNFFDRLFPGMSAIAMRRVGVPKTVTTSLMMTISKMSHRVRMAHVVSPNSIAPLPGEVWNGVGQGSGESSPIWLFTEEVMLKAYKQLAKGVEWNDPLSSERYMANVIGYIDNNNLIQSFDATETRTNISNATSSAYNTWEGLLKATGGSLSNEKAKIFAWNWKWSEGLPKMNDLSKEIPIEGEPEIKLQPLNEPVKFLGIMSNPQGDLKKEFEVRCKEAKIFAKALKTSSLSQQESWTAYTTMWESKVRYYAPINMFTQCQWQKIQSIILQEFLPKIKMNRNTPRSIMLGIPSRGGLVITPAYTQHGYEIVK